MNSLIFENQQLASDFLQQLSKVYRYVLQNKEKDTVSLLIEFDFINNQGMARLKSLYNYLAERPIEIIENDRYYSVNIPLF